MTETTSPAGATPAVAGATPVQTPPAEPAPAPPSPATSSPATDEIGEAGKRAIAAERQAAKDALARAKAAEDELETLKASTQTDHERALTAAKREAAAEVRATYEAKLIRADLRAKLGAAGVRSEALIELALKADTFSGAKLDDDGRVIDGDKLVAKLKDDAPEMFGSGTASAGTVTAGAQTSTPKPAANLEEAVAGHYAKH